MSKVNLLTREDLEACLPPSMASVINADEAHGFVISVVVGGGVRREFTMASLFRVAGNGDRMELMPRRVEMLEVVLKSLSEDLLHMAGIVFEAANKRAGCTILVDLSGLGTQFVKLLESLGADRVVACNWGRRPERGEYKARFFTQRAQCNVHAAEAAKDGRLMLAGYTDLVDQGKKLPFYFDGYGRYHLRTQEEMRELGIPAPDAWGCVAMAFLEASTYVPAQ